MVLPRRSVALVTVALSSTPSLCAVQENEERMNPIRKVVNLLQSMQKKILAEGEKEEALYEKFDCYCKHGHGELSASISGSNAKVPSVQSDIEASQSKLSQTEEDLKKAQVDVSSAKEAMAEATSLREKEAAAFASEKAEYDANIGAIENAVAALERGMSGGFLQTSDADTLRKLALGKQDLLDVDRQALVAFLSQQQTSGYVPSSGEVTGILKTMGDEMKSTLADLTSSEQASILSYEQMMAAKQKEVAALTAAIETKTQQIGELGVAIVQMQQDLSDTEAALIADQKFLVELETSCKTKASEWEERKKTRAEEIVAIADTIKVLNDDDALDLFKKTLPSSSSASLIQVQKSNSRMQARALEALQSARRSANAQDHIGLDLISLALKGRSGRGQKGFEKVLKMIDNMVQVLKTEQQDDEHKREYCSAQLDEADDKKKALERHISDQETVIETTKDGIATVTEDIAALEKGIKDLDKSVTEAAEQRKEEHAEFQALLASNHAAKELLEFAKNRLNKFYNQAQYKPPPKQELSEEDRISVNNGGTLPPTEAPGGIAGTGVKMPSLVQVSQHKQMQRDAPAPPPATWGAYATQNGESNSVIAMIDLLIRDLDKETTEAEVDEKNSQKNYEELMAESVAKRAADTKSLTEKGGAKADLESDLESHKEDQTSATSELMATAEYIKSLHNECDWLLRYFDTRKEARSSEIDSLQRAKAVLQGADFSFVQVSSHHRGFLAK